MSCGLPLSVSASLRLNITLEGISSPVGLVSGAWLSSRLGIHAISILLEEVMGYNTLVSEEDSSISGLYALAGCLNPSHPEPAERQCGPLFSAKHIFFEAWDSYASDFEILARDLQTAPLDLGSVGYAGEDGSYIPGDILSLSLATEGLSLEYYRSYNKTWHNPSIYFSAYTGLNSSRLKKCSQGKLWNPSQIEAYVKLTHDSDGVEIVDSALRAKCEGGAEGLWWFSPSCRSDPSMCIPFLDGGDGWYTNAIMTKAALYNMPIAYAVAASSEDYRHLPSTNRIIQYWWTPDDTFLQQNLVRIIFPQHDAAAWARGDKRSAAKSTRLIKFIHYKMSSVAGRVNQFVEQLRFSLIDMDAMMLDLQLTQDSERLVACRWLQQNPDTWQSWMPDARICFAGWGMISASGDYVESHSLASECAWCRPGRFSTPLVDLLGGTHTCRPCIAGRFQEYPGQTMCDICSAGRYGDSLASSTCRDCVPGTYSKSDASFCEFCTPGKYALEEGSQSCIKCALGTCVASAGSSMCQRCELGRYADIDGMTACTICGARHMSRTSWTTMDKVAGRDEWVYIEGAISNRRCGCDKGLRLEGGDCVACAEGMSCQGMGEVFIIKGYYSELPVSVYHCFGDKNRCPGGPPQDTCAIGRRGISCAECEESKKPKSDGTCTDCTGSDTARFIMSCLIVLSVLCMMYCSLLVNRARAGQNHVKLLSMISCGLLVTLVQQLGVIGTLDVQFEPPIKWLFDATRVLMFDIEIFNIGCIGSMSPLSRFIATASSFFVLLLLKAMIHCISVSLFYKGKFAERMPEFITSMGTVCLVMYISVISAVLGPMQCSQHPNGKWTARTYSAVVCWDSEESPDHTAMVILGLCCLSGPIGFFSFVAWISLRLPQRIREGNIKFLNTYGFLFFRFRPRSGWYIQVILIKSLIVALTPVVPHPMIQIFISYVVHLLSLILVVHCKPWRVDLANAIDAAFSSVVVTVIIMAAFFVKDEDLRFFSWIVTMCVIIACLAVPLAAVRTLYIFFARKQKPYRFFLCHHKAKAGAFARMLKAALVENPKVTQDVFLDSDNLSQLDELFHTVGHDVDCFLIVGTSHVFLRPWCAGEMTVARLKNVKVIILAMPDWEPPDDATIESFDKLVDMQPLSENGISLDLVKSTMRWLGTLPTIQIPTQISFSTLEALAACLTSGMREGVIEHRRSTTSVFNSKVLILADETDMEAVVAAHFLAHLMVPHTVHDPEKVPAVLVDQDLSTNLETLLIICTKGCFERSRFLQLLVKACECKAQALPVIADPNFEFPSSDWLSKIQRGPSLVDGASGEALANMIGNIFNEIAMTFQPQHAPDTILQVNAKQIANRITSSRGTKVLTTQATRLLSTDAFQRRLSVPSVDMIEQATVNSLVSAETTPKTDNPFSEGNMKPDALTNDSMNAELLGKMGAFFSEGDICNV